MSMLRGLAAVAVAGVAALTVGAAPAGAHGALANPMSRVVACGPDGGERARSAACRAALSANGTALGGWDNLRVADVGGRDREVIPDGKLCSAGLDDYAGLDLARADWPATRLRAGADFTFTYGQTIPHKGTFRMYVTRVGYQPTRPLRWADLGTEPFLKVTDPVLKGGSYVIKGKLPKGRTGRHLIYTVWQNSDTPDTYYSCSDVIFGATAAAPAEPDAKPDGAGPDGTGADGTGAGAAADGAGAGGGGQPLSAAGLRAGTWPLFAAGGTVVAAAGLAAAVLVRRRARRPLGGSRHRA